LPPPVPLIPTPLPFSLTSPFRVSSGETGQRERERQRDRERERERGGGVLQNKKDGRGWGRDVNEERQEDERRRGQKR